MQAPRPFSAAVAVVLIASFVSGCGSASSPPSTSSTSVTVRTENGMHFDFEKTEDGVTRRRSIAVGPGVDFTWTSGDTFIEVGKVSVPPSGEGLYLAGGVVECLGDELRIGETSFGPLSSDASLEFTEDGVIIDGEHRGPLPEADRP